MTSDTRQGRFFGGGADGGAVVHRRNRDGLCPVVAGLFDRRRQRGVDQWAAVGLLAMEVRARVEIRGSLETYQPP